MKNEPVKKLLKELRDKQPEAFVFDKKLAAIKSKEDLADFVLWFLRERPDLLSGLTAAQFLEELSVFVRGLDGYYRMKDKALPVTPEWSLFADILVASAMRG